LRVWDIVFLWKSCIKSGEIILVALTSGSAARRI